MRGAFHIIGVLARSIYQEVSEQHYRIILFCHEETLCICASNDEALATHNYEAFGV